MHRRLRTNLIHLSLLNYPNYYLHANDTTLKQVILPVSLLLAF